MPVEIEIPDAEISAEEGWFSPSHGVRVPTPLVRARRMSRPGADATDLVLRVSRR
jgi:hypothetical protein